MASTLLPGDRVIVNKFVTGIRLPISWIGLPGINAPYVNSLNLPYARLPRFRDFRRQDVVAFNFPAGSDVPLDRKRLQVSRIVGLPGDTILVWDKQLYVNRTKIDPPTLSREEFRVVTSGSEIPETFLREFSIEKPRTIAEVGIYDMDLSREAREAVEKIDIVTNVRPTKQFVGDSKQDYYPPSFFFLWNRDQYGPLVVPSKGTTVQIELKNVDLYRDIIETHEKHEIVIDFKGIQIDGIPASEYTFKKDYYFVMDDNRDNPADSRRIGFIPKDHLLGVCHRIVWSGQNKYDYIKSIQAKRFFKSVR